MRPILIVAITIFLGFSVYYDLNTGTIPHSTESEPGSDTIPTDDRSEQDVSTGDISFPYQEVIVESGQTVYGIVKVLHDEEFTVPAYEVIDDFEALNPHVNAHEILIGQTYRFPLYPPTTDEEQS
ncbi:hypothetical protein SAMN05421736_102195 [Evansella caseinilytica]|uniref:LysM domain-containing protein n=1 Tax=Evansella caseinilytica TaxID=1503961 RepID=A0A1H3KMK4_9BACI|nr:hypothetical protein [Evansella caseinilytica]SDY53260.1 hypothetical protein SAMN05421736_102195 [Evansella caseinilytica]